MMKTEYRRKISSEEAREGYILILKNRLSFFPHLRKPFTMKDKKGEKQASVESYHCSCQGPDLPHEHYFIRWSGLKKGMTVAVEKAGDSSYSFSVV
ncbi:MAG TPA: hypothetical protein VII11_09260 [Bacteroidota bacterium]